MSWILQDSLFGFQLGLAVHVDRVRFIRLAIPTGTPVEDFPAGEENEGNVLGQLREVRSDLRIDAAGLFRILLAGFRSAQCRAMNHGVGLDGLPRAFDVRAIGQIEIGTSQSLHSPIRSPSRGGLHKVLSNQSRCSGDDRARCHGG